MARLIVDLTGKRFGRLVVISLDSVRTADHKARWMTECSCGRVHFVSGASLRRGLTRSCGCLRKEMRSPNFKHGMSGTTLYNWWSSIVDRCKSPRHPKYHRYGGRGIRMHPAWAKSFVRFLSYVKKILGDKPSSAHTLDRIDNESGYVPGNIRWATPKMQSRNTGVNRNLTFNGRTQCMLDWASEVGINRTTLRQRLESGWTLERALTVPVRKQRRAIIRAR